MRLLHTLALTLALALAPVLVPAARAQLAPPDAALGEAVVMIKNNRLIPVDLETTIFKPEGNGPFPVVFIHHGKDTGNNRLQPRARFLVATREFLQRGYAVVLPMRQGFAGSGGSVVGEGCNIGGSGEAQADDVRAVVAWVEQQPWADASRMVMLGQSHGGLTTLAYAQQPHPGFKLFVNFAGGLKWSTPDCLWQHALIDAFGRYGAKTRVPSLWFYGENDSYFPPPVIRPAFDAYVKAGGPAELVAYGPFERDAHAMFGRTSGLSIWWPRVQEKLAAAGLPTAVVYPQYRQGPAKTTPVPAPSGFAPVDAVDRVPYLKASGREAYAGWLARETPRAFAIGPTGAFGWAYGGEDPLKRALDNCNRHAAGQCRLYAVDHQVVWKEK